MVTENISIKMLEDDLEEHSDVDTRLWQTPEPVHPSPSAKHSELRVLCFTVTDKFAKIVSLCAGVFLMLCAGTPYMVSMYGQLFRMRYKFTETETIMVETCAHAGLYLGITQGIFYDQYGIKKACLLAATLLFLGYSGVFLTALYGSSAVGVGVCLFLVGQGSQGFHTASAVTNVANWGSTSRGKVMGLLAANFALSSGLFTLVAGGFGLRKEHVSPCQNSSHMEPGERSNKEIYFFLLLGLLFLCAGMIGAVLLNKVNHNVQLESDEIELHNVNEANDDLSELSPEIPTEKDICGLALLKQKVFWLLFVSMAIEDGVAVMFGNALGSMHDSLAAEDNSPPLPALEVLVLVFSGSNALGRLGWGSLSDWFSSNRSLVLFFTMVGMTLSSFLVIVAPSQILITTILVAVNFGGMFAIAPVITAETFGYKHFGTNWGMVIIAPAIGSLSLGRLYGAIYDSNVEGSCGCTGAHCFKTTFIVATILLIFGCCSSGMLAWNLKVGRDATSPKAE
eukprot:m.60439 g.60439  ORF g.60439 m.60439 type:complete len:509 (-) comp11321_c0_seq1:53-1579(-)